MAKISKAADRVLDDRVVGPEPEFIMGNVYSRLELMKALNWYSYSHDISTTRKWILEWMRNAGYSKKDISHISSSKHTIPQTLASMCRCLNRGLTDAEFTQKVQDNIKELLSYTDKPSTKPASPPKIVDNTNPVIAKMDEIVDGFYHNSYKKYDATEIVLPEEEFSSVPLKHFHEAVEYYSALKSEIETFDEGYDHLKKAQKTRYAQLIDDIIGVLEKKTAVKKTRKPRKKKPKSAIQARVASRLKYLKDHELASSISPTQIFTAKVLWTFNPTTRKLTKYTVTTMENFEIKGQTLTNFDEEKSFVITVRKPEETVPNVLSMGVRALAKYIDGLKVKRAIPNGRINDKTLLLRTQK